MTTEVTTPADIGGLVPAEPASIETMVSPEAPVPPTPVELEPAKPTRRAAAAPARPARPARKPKPSPELAKKLPTAERIHVYYREANGKSTFVEDSSRRDLNGFGSIEAFLKHYAVPNYGYGDYEVYMKNSKGELEPVTSASLKAPLDSKGGPGGQSLSEHVKELLNAQAALGQATPKEPSALEQLQTMMTLAEKMNGPKETGMDPMTMMMMMKMMDKPAPAPAGPDPIMIALVQKLEDMEKQQARTAMIAAAPPLPLPAPPPPVDTMTPMLQMMMENGKQQAEANRLMMQAQSEQTNTLLKVLMAPKAERDVMGELSGIATLLKPADDGLKTRDILAMLPTMKDLLNPKPEKGALDSALDQMRMIRMLKEEMGMEEAPAGAGASFWDFMTTAVQSDLGDKIAGAISKSEQEQHTEQAITQGTDAPAEGGPLKVPSAFEPHAKELNEADTTQGRVKAAVSGLQVLLGNKSFRPHVAAILQSSRENKKGAALENMASLFGALVDSEHLTAEAVSAVINDFDQHWVTIMQAMGFKEITEDPDPPTKAEAKPTPDGEAEKHPEGETIATPTHTAITEGEPKKKTAFTEAIELEDEEDEVDLEQVQPDVIDVAGEVVRQPEPITA
jgi:hypothetical protein